MPDVLDPTGLAGTGPSVALEGYRRRRLRHRRVLAILPVLAQSAARGSGWLRAPGPAPGGPFSDPPGRTRPLRPAARPARAAPRSPPRGGRERSGRRSRVGRRPTERSEPAQRPDRRGLPRRGRPRHPARAPGTRAHGRPRAQILRRPRVAELSGRHPHAHPRPPARPAPRSPGPLPGAGRVVHHPDEACSLRDG